MTSAPTEDTEEPRPLSLPRLIVQWYVDNPGLHRCVDVTRSLNEMGVPVDNAQVSNFSRRAVAKGHLVRRLVPREGWRHGLPVYGAASRTVSPPKENPQP